VALLAECDRFFGCEHWQANVEIGMSSVISPVPETMKPGNSKNVLTAFAILTKKDVGRFSLRIGKKQREMKS
jgi:hypothetical protein